MSVLRTILRRTLSRERVLVLGTGPIAYEIAEIIENTTRSSDLVGFLDDQQGLEPATAAAADPLIVGSVERLDEALVRLRPNRLIVALAESEDCLPLRELIRSRMIGIAVETAIEARQRLTGKVAIETLTPSTLVFVGSRRYRRLKRLFSLIAAGMGLVVTAPLMLIIAILIKLDSPGPIFFVQERIGLRGRRFRLIKFRSMVPGDGNNSEWEGDNADRITRLGKWLRRYHLDELPQFINILRGEMEFVGPRPHPLSNYELFEREIPHYALRCETSPGLTGWAQVRNGYANDLAAETEKMRFDLYYLTHQSLSLDLWIVLLTIKIVLFGRDPSDPPPLKQRRRLRQPSSAWTP